MRRRDHRSVHREHRSEHRHRHAEQHEWSPRAEAHRERQHAENGGRDEREADRTEHREEHDRHREGRPRHDLLAKEHTLVRFHVLLFVFVHCQSLEGNEKQIQADDTLAKADRQPRRIATSAGDQERRTAPSRRHAPSSPRALRERDRPREDGVPRPTAPIRGVGALFPSRIAITTVERSTRPPDLRHHVERRSRLSSGARQPSNDRVT